MKTREKTIFISIVFLELVAAVFLGRSVVDRRFGALGSAISVLPINRSDIVFSKADGLHYFYELIPNVELKSQHPFLPPGNYLTIVHNSDSLNERFEYSVEKPAGTYRIIALGDSFTFGALVDTKDNYPEQLEDLLNNELRCKNIGHFEVINLGVYGYDLWYSAERFLKRGEKYNPDLVLWFVKLDDFFLISDSIHPNIYEMPQSTDEPDGIGIQGGAVTNSALVEISRQAFKQYGLEGLGEYPQSALHEFSDHYKGALVLFSFPLLGTYHALPASISGYFIKITEAFVSSRENTYFYGDLTNIHAGKENYWPDKHPTPKGYSLIANDLLNYLTENRIIPCE